MSLSRLLTDLTAERAEKAEKEDLSPVLLCALCASAVNPLRSLACFAVNFPRLGFDFRSPCLRNLKERPRRNARSAAYVKLERAASAAFAYARVGLEEEGLTLSQFAVLEALYHVGPQCLGDLARRILTSSGNLTLVIDNLQKRGLVKREQQGKDKRFVLACITPSGEKLIAKIFPSMRAESLKSWAD